MLEMRNEIQLIFYPRKKIEDIQINFNNIYQNIHMKMLLLSKVTIIIVESDYNYCRKNLSKPIVGIERMNAFAFIILITFASAIGTINFFPIIWAHQENQSNNINATYLYQTHSMVLSPSCHGIFCFIIS